MEVNSEAEDALSPKIYKYKLHTIIPHEMLPPPTSTKTGELCLIKTNFTYFHYGCDGFKDKGWGCAYRTIQSMCSQILHVRKVQALKPVPSLREIQECLVKIGDKPPRFTGSTDFIGAIEACLTLGHFYNVDCKVVHIRRISELHTHVGEFKEHFKRYGTMIMAGGDFDRQSKGIAGIYTNGADTYFLVVDPHFIGIPNTVDELIDSRFIKWMHASEFVDSSFYNFCLPQVPCAAK